jgi:hypothetical protein
VNNIGKTLGPNPSNRGRALLIIVAGMAVLALFVLGSGELARSPSAPAENAALVAAPTMTVYQPVAVDYNDCETDDWEVVAQAAPASAAVHPVLQLASAPDSGGVPRWQPVSALQILDIPPPR